mmetsp:Transcript_11004/g.16016  ORF Transcript_11004/g.16016 Transcript_11004/m.16016 type:complete len:129 (-) Transcript_11004:575-961(-)|eukprot:CAMPEP_0197244588 /NCGR_PEP_ID=MMETSP1429-20130617/9665_1 /TAXON_ID=49237 /ORGANISM="Chaetoceros  sp., Strain UNC1202" /LENGTH=128 /DNA_ID=CAMNT_0042704969 /DNA_START=76 /DNA_END=462 /DNA_ORIENTATION=-
MSALKGLPLYRSILRAHKHLPSEMRALGDVYVKTEFRQHQNVTKEDQLTQFHDAWNKYLSGIEQTSRALESKAAGLDVKVTNTRNDDANEVDQLYSFGADLETGIEMTEEQKTQLEKLREEAFNVRTK